MATNGKQKLPDSCPTCRRPYMLPDHVEQVLREVDGELPLGELVTKLEHRGVFPPGSARYGEVFNALKRNPKRFRKVSRGLYELR